KEKQQGPNAAFPRGKTMPKQDWGQRKNKEGRQNADNNQPGKNRKRAVDLVILGVARCIRDEAPKIPWLNRKEEEGAVIRHRPDVEFVSAVEVVEIVRKQKLTERAVERCSG